MQIKLYMDGNKKTFTVPFIKARMLRRSIELGEQLGDGKTKKQASLADIDAMADFVVDLFDDQFSIDELWDGLTNEEFLPELRRCMNECMTLKGASTDPNVRKRSK